MGDKVYGILLADDNEGDVYLVRTAIERHAIEHDLFVVGDGEQALDFLKGLHPASPPPRLIILDLRLPKVDGLEVLAAIRRTPLLSETPVIALSSSESPHDREMVRVMGGDAYFQKPADLHAFMKLGEVIKAMLVPKH